MYRMFRIQNKRLAAVSAVTIILTILLGACGPAAATSTTVPTTVPTTAPTTAPTAVPTVAGPVQSGLLRVAMQPIVQTDPAMISSDSEVLVANAVYDYLVDVDTKSSIQPRLATKWDISADGLTYTFTLAPGVTFHDGSAFSAKDVVWTFNRLRDPALGLPTADLYKNIASVTAEGDNQVVFKLTATNPFFLYDLSDNHALILKADTADPTKFNGTGAFKVTNYSAEDRIELAANEKYFIAGEPKLANLTILFFGDENASVDALKGGQVDLVMRMSTALFTSLKTEPGIVTTDIPTNGFDLVRLRSDRKPGSDPRVIQAMKLATDRQAILDLVQQGYGALGNDSPIGPLYAAYHSEETPVPARDVAAAHQLLVDAGYADGLKLDLHTPDTGGRPDLAAVLKSQWAEAGIDLNVIVEPESVYYGDNGWLEVDLGITGWGSRPYPQFYLDTMLVTGAKWNESHYSDPEFDKLAATAGTTLDEKARIQAYKDIQKILIESGPVIIPYYFAQFAAIRDNFQGFAVQAFAGRTDFRNVSSTK